MRVDAVQVEPLVAKDLRAACFVHRPKCDIYVLSLFHLLLVADDLRLLAVRDGVFGGYWDWGLAHHGRVFTLLASLGRILIGLELKTFLHLPLIVLLVVLLLIILDIIFPPSPHHPTTTSATTTTTATTYNNNVDTNDDDYCYCCC